MNDIIRLIFIFFIHLLLVSCTIQENELGNLIIDDNLPSVDLLTTQINTHLTDTILLAELGGPTQNFDTTRYEWFHDIPTMSMVYVRQYQQTTNITNDSLISQQEAKNYNDITVSILNKVINYYKRQGKVIIVFGHSFGAFTLTRYIDYYNVDNVDKFIMMAGRLKMDSIPVLALSSGYSYHFENGINPAFDSIPTTANLAMAKLAAEMATPSYIDSLENVDLTKVFYQFGTYDNTVGRLLPNEVNFLNNANATVLEIPFWSHLFPDSIYLKQMLDFIRE